MSSKPVNIREIFSKKNPRIATLLPPFIYRYLERIIHQYEVNDFMARHGDKYGVEFARAGIREFNVTLKVEGLEKLTPGDRYIIASNHPLGGFDGLLLLDSVSRIMGDSLVLVNDILMNLVNLRPVFVPVNKHGKQDTDAARLLIETFTSNKQVITFPAGLVSRKIGKQVLDLKWQKNFISMAIRYKRDVVPVHVSGRNTEFFYRLSRWRRRLGIKTNIEMFYLVDETYNHKNKTINICFGEPLPYNSFDKSKTHLEWAKWVKEKAYLLGGIDSIPL